MRIGEKNTDTAIAVLGAFKCAIRKYGRINVCKENEQEIIEYINIAIEALKNQQKVCDWIPCKERLPDDDTFVLAQVDGKYKNTTFENSFEFATYIKGEGWTLETYPDWYNPNIIAWRPIPEPYTENQKE